MILGKMVIQLSKEPSQRLLKHVVSVKIYAASKIFEYLKKYFLRCDATCACLTTPAPARRCVSVSPTS